MELCLTPTVVGKGSKGRTACGSSAYRACDKLIDNAGNVHDFSHKHGHVLGGIELPTGAPEELRDRQTLWSRHELKDKRKDAELYRDVMVTLPNELSYSASERVARGLAALLTEKGMCVQWDIHDVTQKGQRNLHCHMMITMRELLPDGTFGKKDRSWNKYNGGLNIADLLRPEAARLMNEELELIGSSERVEHKSYAERGIDKIPTKHMGVAATAMERKGTPTQKGYRNKYIKWLNNIHAENLRQVEAQEKPAGLDAVISAARAQGDGTQVFKDWDALFAMLRDTRRCRAALKGELKKIDKITSAYAQMRSAETDEERERARSYITWAGCDPDNDAWEREIRGMQYEARLAIKQMDLTEAYLLDSKELLKARNKVIYTAKKVSWDEYQIDRNKRGIAYCDRRLDSIRSYRDYLTRSISLFDMIFQTEAWEGYCYEMQRLRDEEQQLYADRIRNRAELKQAKKDLKQDAKAAKEAARNEKKVRKQHPGDPTDPDNR